MDKNEANWVRRLGRQISLSNLCAIVILLKRGFLAAVGVGGVVVCSSGFSTVGLFHANFGPQLPCGLLDAEGPWIDGAPGDAIDREIRRNRRAVRRNHRASDPAGRSK